MAVILVDGFDMYNGNQTLIGLQSKWAVAGSISFIALAAGRFGGQCVSYTGAASGGSVARTFTANNAVAYGAAFRSVALPSSNSPVLLGLEASGTVQVGWRVTTLGALEVLRAGTSIGISANGVIAANTWHYVESEVVINDTTGRFTIYVDGAQVLNLTNVDTRNGVPTTVDTIRLGYGAGALTSYVFNIDDVYVVDVATKLGERRVETLRPNADTATKNWTPLSGVNNYAMVNETTVDGDTSYNQASAVGTRDLYAIGSLSSTPAAIDAIQISSFAEKTDATTRTLYNSVQSAGTDSDGSAFSLAASYGKLERILATDPNGGGAWTASRVNGLLIGPKVAS